MILGYGIIAVPTGIVSVELQQAVRRNRELRCPACGLTQHEIDAAYCRLCGGTLHQGEVATHGDSRKPFPPKT
jgi:voltage-gated potassium channel